MMLLKCNIPYLITGDPVGLWVEIEGGLVESFE